MEVCKNCGKPLKEGMSFCEECGTKIDPQETKTIIHTPMEEDVSLTIKTSYYFWMSFAYSIPLIGWGICLFNAFANQNKSKRNHARAIILSLVVMLCIGFAITFAVKATIHYALDQAGVDIDEIKENGFSSEMVMEYLEENELLPSELEHFIDEDGKINLEGLDSEKLDQFIQQLNSDGSLDLEALLEELSSIQE